MEKKSSYPDSSSPNRPVTHAQTSIHNLDSEQYWNESMSMREEKKPYLFCIHRLVIFRSSHFLKSSFFLSQIQFVLCTTQTIRFDLVHILFRRRYTALERILLAYWQADRRTSTSSNEEKKQKYEVQCLQRETCSFQSVQKYWSLHPPHHCKQWIEHNK